MLSIEEVKKIAQLSKLEFSSEELENISKDLNEIFKYVEMINEVDVSNIEPLFNPLDLEDVLREDVVSNTLNKKDFLDNSSISDDEFIIVPKIVE